MEFEYVPLGNSCSPAAAVQTLEIRKFALPFDWVMSTYNGICQCINEDFKNFHKHLRVESNKSRIVDYYNISFPHDYSTTTTIPDDLRVLYISCAQQLCHLYQNASKVITTRAHTSVCCLSENIPIEYYGYMDNRALGIFKNMDIDFHNKEYLDVETCNQKIKMKKETYIHNLKDFFLDNGVVE